MTKEEFDATELIGGFSLVAIKHAIAFLGITEDRDDVAHVAGALGCGKQQAARVLKVLERRGLVTKAAKRRRWEPTEQGLALVYDWHPPRKYLPAIERDEERGVYGHEFASVPCSVLRSAPDNEDVFEEAELDVAVSVSYESERLVEVNVSQPDDYDEPDAGGLIALSAYLSIADAKAFADGLDKAISWAEREIERRATKKARQEKRAERNRHRAPIDKPKPATSAKAGDEASKQTKQPAKRLGPSKRVVGDSRTGEVLAASLKELRESNRARRNSAQTGEKQNGRKAR